MSKLKVEGPLGIDGSLQLTGQPGEKSPSSSNWDFTLDLENGRIECGAAFEHIHGSLNLVGGHGPQGLSGRGEIAVDSVFLKDVQLAEVHGPLTLDQDRIAFGTWAAASTPRSRFAGRR